jgi:hypothetical protein
MLLHEIAWLTFFAGHDVEVCMQNILASDLTVVHAEVVAAPAYGFGDLGRELVNSSHKRAGIFNRVGSQIFGVLLGDDECVTGTYGADVEKGEHTIVLVDFMSWNLTSNDFAKQTVSHILIL